MIGVVQRRDTGRPEICYGRRCARDVVEHETRVTDFALFFPDCRLTRDAYVGRTEADAVMTRAGHRCYVEIDNSGKMSARQMTAKWARYRQTPGEEPANAGAATLRDEDFILVVAVTEARMQRLRRGADLVKAVALFTTFERLASGQPGAWIDWYGKATDV